MQSQVQSKTCKLVCTSCRAHELQRELLILGIATCPCARPALQGQLPSVQRLPRFNDQALTLNPGTTNHDNSRSQTGR